MKKQAALLIIVFWAVLNGLFFKAIWQDRFILFSNDGPLGQNAAAKNELPSGFYGIWDDNNWIGGRAPDTSLGPSGGVRLLCFLTPWPVMIGINLAVLAGAFYLYFTRRDWRGVMLNLTGAGSILVALGIAGFMVLGPRWMLEYLPPIGCLSLLFAIVIVYSLRPDL